MMTAAEEQETYCPICTEKMDSTDRQLKPCKCGYEVCLLCWNQMMDMAEKNSKAGQCPGCRCPYDKQNILATAATNMERSVAHNNKGKTIRSLSDDRGRKQFSSSARVIQRNLVYIVGLPLNMADEDLLQRRQYLGQYGRVLKVSFSRTAEGAIRRLSNNSCSVFVTFSKEEEARRCIRSMNGIVFDGRSLKASFGTTKYCHAWLRGVPCKNPGCPFLHGPCSPVD